jgi:hypothetical protein
MTLRLMLVATTIVPEAIGTCARARQLDAGQGGTDERRAMRAGLPVVMKARESACKRIAQPVVRAYTNLTDCA